MAFWEWINKPLLLKLKSLTITKPLMDEKAALQIAADFAKMKSEKDYNEIIGKLNSLIAANQISPVA